MIFKGLLSTRHWFIGDEQWTTQSKDVTLTELAHFQNFISHRRRGPLAMLGPKPFWWMVIVNGNLEIFESIFSPTHLTVITEESCWNTAYKNICGDGHIVNFQSTVGGLYCENAVEINKILERCSINSYLLWQFPLSVNSVISTLPSSQTGDTWFSKRLGLESLCFKFSISKMGIILQLVLLWGYDWAM